MSGDIEASLTAISGTVFISGSWAEDEDGEDDENEDQTRRGRNVDAITHALFVRLPFVLLLLLLPLKRSGMA